MSYCSPGRSERVWAARDAAALVPGAEARAIARALSPFPRIAGAASSPVGVVQLGSGALAGAVIAGFDDGTQMPLAIGMPAASAAGLIAFAIVRRLTADNPASDISR